MYEVSVEALTKFDPHRDLQLHTYSVYLYAKLLFVDGTVSELQVASLDGSMDLWLPVAARAGVPDVLPGDLVKVTGEWTAFRTMTVHMVEQVADAAALMDPERINRKTRRVRLTMKMAEMRAQYEAERAQYIANCKRTF